MDTGFNGYLAFPQEIIRSLGFSFHSYAEAELGDANTVTLRKFVGSIHWGGIVRDVTVLETAGTPLVGMALLEGHRVTADIIAGGRVCIEPISHPGS